MANPWFRLYSEFADDPKVQMLSEAMQRRLIMLFCSRCKGETLHETERAFQLRISPSELAETKTVFLEKGFIDEQWNVLNWNRRQFLSDSSTDRVRRHRWAKKQEETLHETPRNVTVTAPDTETDTEQIQKQIRKKKRDAPFVLEEWVPDEDWQNFVEHRNSIRKPLKSPHAMRLAVEDLRDIVAKGHTPKSVFDNSIRNGWAGLFEPKSNGGSNGTHQRNRYPTKEEITLAAAQNASRFDSQAVGGSGDRAAGDDSGGGILGLLQRVGGVSDRRPAGSGGATVLDGATGRPFSAAEPGRNGHSLPECSATPPRGRES